MQCEGFDTRLQTLLDRRLRPEVDDELLAHAAGCAGCCETLTAQESLFAGLELCDPPEVTPEFTDRVLADFRAHRPARISGRVWAVALSVAAALLIAAVPIWQWMAGGPASPTIPAVAETTDPGSKPPSAPDSPENPSGAPDSSDDTDTDRTDQNDADAAISRIVENVRSQYQDGQFSLERPLWVDEVAGGLKPLASTMTGALKVLRRTLPGGGKGETSDKPQADAVRSFASGRIA